MALDQERAKKLDKAVSQLTKEAARIVVDEGLSLSEMWAVLMLVVVDIAKSIHQLGRWRTAFHERMLDETTAAIKAKVVAADKGLLEKEPAITH
jgi:hypothetical protein